MLSLRSDNMIAHIKWKKSTDKLLELLGEYSKTIGCKFSIQRLLHFYAPATNNYHGKYKI